MAGAILPILVPPEVRFACTECADCCRGVNIQLADGERERLEALAWPEADAALLFRASVVPLPGGGHRLARRDDGACVYLSDRGRCRIHERFGAEAKPLACRLYPFRLAALAGRPALDVAFSCRAVAEERGPLVDGRDAVLAEVLAAGRLAEAKRHRWRPGSEITGELAWELEERVLEVLDHRERTLFDRIRAALLFLRCAATGDPRTPQAALLRRTLAAGLVKQVGSIPAEGGMDATGRAVFRQILFVALNPVPPGFAEASAAARRRELARREAAATALLAGDGNVWLDGRELAVPLAAAERVDARAFRGPGLNVVHRFLRAKVVGQRFLAAGAHELPLIDAFRLLFLFFPMLVFAARALAAERGASAVGDEDVRRGLRLLDRSVGAIDLGGLPAKQREAFAHALDDGDLVIAATLDLTG